MNPFGATTMLVMIAACLSSPTTSTLDNKIRSNKDNKVKTNNNSHNSTNHSDDCPCTCGIFLSGQFKKGSKDQPTGNPVLLQEMDSSFGNNGSGNRQCINKCLELIVKHLSKSGDIVCAMIDRDCVREKAYLFVKNHSCVWQNTNLSAGREFCCKDNHPYKCSNSNGK